MPTASREHLASVVLTPPDHPNAGCHGLPADAVTLPMCGGCDLLLACRTWATTTPDLEPLTVAAGYSPTALAAARRARQMRSI